MPDMGWTLGKQKVDFTPVQHVAICTVTEEVPNIIKVCRRPKSLVLSPKSLVLLDT